MSGQIKNDTGERKLRVTLLSAGWKASSNGDLTTINRELAIQMAKRPNVEVSVFLPQCSEEDKKDADSYNVKLTEAVKLSGFEPVDWLASIPEGHAMDCVIGHGVALGRQIQIIKKNPNYGHCKWIQVVHTSPEEIGMYKSISEGQQMQQTEIELCEMADQVVTIGPKLTDAYKHQLRKQDVFNLTPSIFTEFSGVQHASEERRTFCVLVTESGESEDFYVKGYDIAVKAIAELKDKSYHLKFASKQRGKEDELANKLLQCGIGCNQLMICSFDENRETLANLFSAVDIAILPSKTEGFGLSALEAISAGLPVLVSGNSGIAEALRKVPIGSQCVVDSEDPAEWARAIKAVRYKERNVRLTEARILRENYLQQFSWEKPCNSLVEKMYSLAFGGEMKITVGVDYLKPEEQNMQTGMLTTESVRQQEVQPPRASATSAAPGSVSHPQTEDLLALKEKNFQSILEGCYHSTKPQSIEEWNWFREYAKEMRLIITGVSVGSLVITVKCESLMILEELWKDYSSGHLGEVVQNCFVTERILKELNLAELRLKTTMDIEEYNACKMFFEKDTLRGALSSEFHSTSSTSESSQKKQQWEKSEQKTKIMETVKLEDQKLNIKVDVEHMKLADHDAYSTASVSALEPAGYQKASTALGTKRKIQSDADLEDLEPLKKKVLCLISMNYLDTTPAEGRDEGSEFKEYLQEMRVLIIGVSVGSLVITVKCDSLKSLEELWEDYSCGLLDKMVRDCFVTEKILKELNLAELKLKTTIDTEEYNAYKLYFLEKAALRGASSSEFHSTSSTSESPQNQEELKKWKQKTKIVETEKLKDTSPLTVIPTTGHGKELIGKAQGRKGMLPLLGSSTSDPEEEVEELHRKLQSMKGASSSEFHSISSTSESPQNQEELKKWKQKTKIDEKGGEMNIKVRVHVDELKPERQDMQTGMLATESVRYQEVQQPRASATLTASGSVSYPQTEDLHAHNKKMLVLLGRSYLQTTPPQSSEEFNRFQEYLKRLWDIISGTDISSFHGTSPLTVVPTTGHGKELTEKEQGRKGEEEGTSPLTVVATTGHGKEVTEKEQGRKGEEEGTSLLTVVPTTGHGKELTEKEQGRKGEEEGQFESIFKVNIFGEFSYCVKGKEVCFWDNKDI